MASRRGRIRPHERATNDEVAILGANVSVSAEHSASVRATEQKDLTVEVKRNYRNRLKHIYKFWEQSYPEYYEVGVCELTSDELADEDLFFWKNKHDIIYAGLNVQMVKAFLGHKKQKENGKTSSHVQLRKYHDAILWGSKTAKSPLPRSYYEEMDRFLLSFKKETTTAKRDGMLDEQEADPISRTLFRQMLKWALADKNIFVWVFSILQWNCMARSVNIGVLGFHNFRVEEDSVVIKYDKSKNDQTGEKAHDKHLYSNVYNPLVSVNLSLGIWCALNPC